MIMFLRWLEEKISDPLWLLEFWLDIRMNWIHLPLIILRMIWMAELRTTDTTDFKKRFPEFYCNCHNIKSSKIFPYPIDLKFGK